MDVACIRCGAWGSEHRIGVDVVSGEIHCSQCDEAYTAAEVEAHLAAWAALLPWIRSHPAVRAAAEVAG